MARRIKEEPIVHQNRIADRALELFARKGIDNTSMDDIAKAAGYSKATLYVYFTNKEEIISFLSFKSMKTLRDVILESVCATESVRDSLRMICKELGKYYDEQPDLYKRALDYMCIDADDCSENMYHEAYKAGEEINTVLIALLKKGVANGELKPIDNYFEIVFQIWGMTSGLISLSREKEEYINLTGKITRDKFLSDGIEMILNCLST